MIVVWGYPSQKLGVFPYDLHLGSDFDSGKPIEPVRNPPCPMAVMFPQVRAFGDMSTRGFSTWWIKAVFLPAMGSPKLLLARMHSPGEELPSSECFLFG